jgi:AAA ATPase domain
VGPSTPRFDVGGHRLATPPIRGRAGELKVIGAVVTALVSGHGGVLVVEGPPGIGKSRLLTELMALADKCGVRTLFGEAFEYQQIARPTAAGTHRQAASQGGVGRGGEGRGFLVTHVFPTNLPRAADRVGKSVEAIAR